MRQLEALIDELKRRSPRRAQRQQLTRELDQAYRDISRARTRTERDACQERAAKLEVELAELLKSPLTPVDKSIVEHIDLLDLQIELLQDDHKRSFENRLYRVRWQRGKLADLPTLGELLAIDAAIEPASQRTLTPPPETPKIDEDEAEEEADSES